MKRDYLFWKKQHDGENLELFNDDPLGQLWLKTKSIVRKEIISEFNKRNSINLSSTTLSKQFEELFDLLSKDVKKSHAALDKYISYKNKSLLKNLTLSGLLGNLIHRKLT